MVIVLIVVIILLVIAVGVLSYLIYDKVKKTPERVVEKEKVEMIKKSKKHYDHVFNYNINKAYGGK